MCRRKDILERIQARTEKQGSCIVWQGAKSTSTRGEKPYGTISINGCTSYVHRVVYVCHNGYISSRTHVDHLCKNRLCVNPQHLEAVTPKQNMKRRSKRNA